MLPRPSGQGAIRSAGSTDAGAADAVERDDAVRVRAVTVRSCSRTRGQAIKFNHGDDDEKNIRGALGDACLRAHGDDTSVRAADVTYERLANPEPQNWLMNHRDFGAQRFSPLDTINKSNVKSMRLLFAVALGGTSGNEALEVTPLVDDGFMYISDQLGRRLQDRRARRQGRAHRLEDGPRPGEARPQSRRRALEQSRHLGRPPTTGA